MIGYIDTGCVFTEKVLILLPHLGHARNILLQQLSSCYMISSLLHLSVHNNAPVVVVYSIYDVLLIKAPYSFFLYSVVESLLLLLCIFFKCHKQENAYLYHQRRERKSLLLFSGQVLFELV